MTSDTTVQLALIGLISYLLRANTKALNKVSKSSDKVANATTKSAKEAAERNGHLAEHSAQIVEMVNHGNELTGKIVERLEATAVIAAEDRDVLTNQNQHIATEVGKIMDKKK